METTPNGWTVIDRGAGVLVRPYRFSAQGLANTMAARMPDGTMLVMSPGCRMPDAAYEDLLAFGDVGALVVNNGWHHLGVPEWSKRFPHATLHAPAASLPRLSKKSEVGDAFAPVEALAARLGDRISLREAPGTRSGESWLRVKVDGGHVWYASDILANIPEIPPSLVARAMFGLTRSAPGFRVFHLALMLTAKDKRAVLTALLDDLNGYPPSVLVPAHGDVLRRPDLADDATRLVASAL